MRCNTHLLPTPFLALKVFVRVKTFNHQGLIFLAHQHLYILFLPRSLIMTTEFVTFAISTSILAWPVYCISTSHCMTII
ncbi:mating-type switching protein swi10 [Histoplasma capsulatum]|uniref:Mating-type switching protein swi10 n=1 Tax=Ajellomyces capsulatus TaxID=5037 RepID=A0A8A1MI58_AJECA|nr:mating-type switching protein swi10 [Histoplasma capsulatum]